MKALIIASSKDPAGRNIINHLKNLGCNYEIKFVNVEVIHAENVDKEINKRPDFIVWVSKHQSEKKIKSLSVHPIGNWKKADFGGKDNMVCTASALMLKHFFQILKKNSGDIDYVISLEATHHGPYIETPSLFIEIGSSESEWKDAKAGEIIAKTVLEALETFDKDKYEKDKIAIGIGGPHYCPNFNPIQLGNKFAISHIIAQYALPIDEGMIKHSIEKTIEPVTHFIIDWKGLGKSSQRQQALNVLKKFHLEIIRTSDAK